MSLIYKYPRIQNENEGPNEGTKVPFSDEKTFIGDKLMLINRKSRQDIDATETTFALGSLTFITFLILFIYVYATSAKNGRKSYDLTLSSAFKYTEKTGTANIFF